MPKPMRAKGARRLNITDELKSDIRRRYEQTPERLATMAADLGCCVETVRNMAKRESWVRYQPPPRDLSPAARLLARAEALSPLIPAQAGIQGQDGKAVPCRPGSPLARGRAVDDAAPPQSTEKLATSAPDDESSAGTADLHAGIAAEMLHEVAGLLADVRAERKRMKREGYAKHELQAVSRVIGDLSASLYRLRPMAQRAAEPDPGTAYDDIPVDLDAFRRNLARRIRLFVDARRRARSGAGDAVADRTADAGA